MANPMDAEDWLRYARSPGGMPIALPFEFTTDSTGASTLVDDYDGMLSLADTEDSAGPTGVYTLTARSWTRKLGYSDYNSVGATNQATVAFSATNGTITITFAGGAPTSGTYGGTLWVSTSEHG